jgi:hypothetical protein
MAIINPPLSAHAILSAEEFLATASHARWPGAAVLV